MAEFVQKYSPAARRARRILEVACSVTVTIIGLCSVTFVLGRMLPIDPVLAVLGEDASREAYTRMASEMGLDKPLFQQFLTFMWDLLRLDFGRSVTTGHEVAEDLIRVVGATVELSLVAIVIATAIGVPAGVLAAVRHGNWQDHLIRILTLIGHSAPVFWLGLMGLSIFYAQLGWVSGVGRIDVLYQYDITPVTGLYLIDTAIGGQWDIFRDVVSHIILPGSVLGYVSMAYIARMTRSFMLAQLNQEYILAARSKGASAARVIWHHAFRNILVQILTVVSLTFAFLLEGAVLVETVFAWPGFGRYFTTGLMAGDMNIVVPCTLIVGVIFIAINLLCDLLHQLIDPRIRR